MESLSYQSIYKSSKIEVKISNYMRKVKFQNTRLAMNLISLRIYRDILVTKLRRKI